ncbi:MAG: c-type cytochrome biogenesis protein CcmI [Alphaproteobacteria bacterium]|nr:c-type cytochrome biogenesis protein CcmI [Alphaproteobacteria bacterium]
MILWLTLGGLTLAVVAGIVWPLLRRPAAPPPSRGAFDRSIYRDQLAELARDVERGVVDAGQAAAARLEIERRLLATESGDAAEPGAASAAPVDGVTIVMLAASVSAGAVALYLALGSPHLGDAPFAAREAELAVAQNEARAHGDPASSAKALEARLKDHPDDAQGWLLLARAQAAMEHWQDSTASYQRAIELTHGAPEANAGYGEMLVQAADGMVTPAAREAFAAALAKDAANPSARYYLALADAQAGKPREALDAWAKLVGDAPPGAGWVAMVRRTMEDTAKSAGLELPPMPAPTGPSAAEVAAAGKMSPEERQKMIRGMVDALAARLEANPDDAAGWLRLANAYRVLGEAEKAESAAARAAALRPNDVATLLEQAHVMLAATGAGHDPATPLPARSSMS